MVAQTLFEQVDTLTGEIQVFESFLNSAVSPQDWRDRGYKRRVANIRDCFESLERRVRLVFEGDYIPRDKSLSESPYKAITRIAFSEVGASVMEEEVGARIPREFAGETTQFTVTLVSIDYEYTRTRFKKDRKLIPLKEPVTTARDFPKSYARRKQIISYIRRAYPQRVRP